MLRSLIDRLQVWLYLAGFIRLAMFVGRFGTQAQPVRVRTVITGADIVQEEDGSLSFHERDTQPDNITVDDADVESRSGPGWSLDEDPPSPLRIIKFDPTFNKNDPRIDPARDLAFPKSKLDVN